MSYLIYIFVSLSLAIGFLVLTCYERNKSVRFLNNKREKLDTFATRVSFIIEHVDFGAFIREEFRIIVARISHDIVHLTLQIVRFAERLLTRMMRKIRTVNDVDFNNSESSRPFVRTMSEFKTQLKATRPEVFDIQ